MKILTALLLIASIVAAAVFLTPQREPTPKPESLPVARDPWRPPTTLAELLALPKQDLDRVGIVRMNLLCAEGLPGAEDLDIDDVQQRVNEAARAAVVQTGRHLYRVTDPRYQVHYRHSETYFRCEMLCQSLTEQSGLKYNMEQFYNPDFRDSRAQFIHGLLRDNSPGGTCVSIPVLVAAVGRQLGYPIKLVLAREHVFARWDGPGDSGEPMRLNIETSGLGLDSYIDERYRAGKTGPISDEEIERREFLVSLTPNEELAVFLAARGHCLFDNGRLDEALDAYRLATERVPQARAYSYFIEVTEATRSGRLAALRQKYPNGLFARQPELPEDRARAYLWRNPRAR